MDTHCSGPQARHPIRIEIIHPTFGPITLPPMCVQAYNETWNDYIEQVRITASSMGMFCAVLCVSIWMSIVWFLCCVLCFACWFCGFLRRACSLSVPNIPSFRVRLCYTHTHIHIYMIFCVYTHLKTSVRRERVSMAFWEDDVVIEMHLKVVIFWRFHYLK